MLTEFSTGIFGKDELMSDHYGCSQFFGILEKRWLGIAPGSYVHVRYMDEHRIAVRHVYKTWADIVLNLTSIISDYEFGSDEFFNISKEEFENFDDHEPYGVVGYENFKKDLDIVKTKCVVQYYKLQLTYQRVGETKH